MKLSPFVIFRNWFLVFFHTPIDHLHWNGLTNGNQRLRNAWMIICYLFITVFDISFLFSLVQQYKLSKYCEEIFGDLLLRSPIPDSDVSMWPKDECYLTGPCTNKFYPVLLISCVWSTIIDHWLLYRLVFHWKQQGVET